MIKVHENIYVGMARMIHLLNKHEFAFVGVSSKYHYELHSWQKGFKYADDPCYLICQKDTVMSVNWVDAAERFYDWKGIGLATFRKILDFIQSQTKKVYIFCDQGQSRSPSVALLYLAKRLKVIRDENFDVAMQDFLLLYPHYNPGGIKDFIRHHWNEIQ